ncbi:threonine/serine exporter family protein [Actinomadura parmotrematis]|uniref:Threonine/serine exporter family protein n=1 Tax=Actinomadura parmotrematis TaxID=2864039 RepID=A0ABS7FSH4_9ACTN|nr:threonine/serine exporter family protein [Actinomadura parmotrematis]MBW8483348.1 threonine/serine exporter family protein [Actinomadura parmotrematis]
MPPRVRGALDALRPVAPPVPEDGPPPELVRYLRDLAVALCESGEPSTQVTAEIGELARAYGAAGFRIMVLPTGVWVRSGPTDGGPGGPMTLAPEAVDFAPVGANLRLDQVGEVRALLADSRRHLLDPGEGALRLARVKAEPSRLSPATVLTGHAVLTLGLGLIRDATTGAMAGYLLLGLLVGALRLLAGRVRNLALVLPVLASLLITVLAYRFAGALADGDPVQLLVPPLVSLLPGAALTVGAIDLAAGAMVAGSSRLIYGINVLFLLAFGILVGVQAAHATPVPDPEAASLGWWAPWLGVLLLGVGFYMHYSAPAHTLPWLLVALYTVWTVQVAGSALGGALLGAFLGAAAITPLGYALQSRRNAPATQVTFLTSFWMLVPGALGLTSLRELLDAGGARGAAGLLNALLAVIAIALGTLVGSSLRPRPRA